MPVEDPNVTTIDPPLTVLLPTPPGCLGEIVVDASPPLPLPSLPLRFVVVDDAVVVVTVVAVVV